MARRCGAVLCACVRVCVCVCVSCAVPVAGAGACAYLFLRPARTRSRRRRRRCVPPGARARQWPSTKGRSLPEFLKHEKESQAHFAKPEIRDALNRNDWNRYIIHCRGDRISIELNGVKITNLRDSTDAQGHIAIQHHGEEGQTYRFRNLYLRELTDE